MEKIDLRKQLKHLYQPSAKKIELVDVPPLQFALVDGAIEPGQGPGTSQSFQEALQALYGISYTLKFMLKKRAENPIDYTVMGLEALWWIETGEFDIRRQDNWQWRAMILQPDFVTGADFEEALSQLRKKKPSPGLEKLRFEPYQEGLCVQTMHIGPYAEEPATLERMKAYAREQGYTLSGLHHEIYLGNPLAAAPEKLKTVLRHPVTRVE